MTNKEERNKNIVTLKKNGYSYALISKKYRISRERVKQICHEHGVGGSANIYLTKVGIIEQKKLF